VGSTPAQRIGPSSQRLIHVSKSLRDQSLTYLGLLAIVALFLVQVDVNFAPAFHAGVDEHAYLLSAKSLATHGSFARHLSDPYQFTGENMVQTAPHTFYPKTPIGYPLLCAAAYKLGGPSAPFLVNPVLATLAVLGIFLLGRAVGGNALALCASLLLATNPLHLFYAQQSMSHAADICLATWAILFIYCWASDGAWYHAALAGLLLGFDAAVRPTAVVLVLPMAAMAIFRLRRLPQERRKTVTGCSVLLLASAAGALPMFVHQAVAFGSPLTSGYSLTGETTAFSMGSFREHLAPMLTDFNTPGFGLFLVFPAALLGLMFWPKLRARHYQRLGCAPASPQPPVGWLLGLWALPSLLLYTAYYWYPTSNNVPLYLRFFLSIYPPLILLTLLLVFALVGRKPVYGVFVFLACVLISAATLAQEKTSEAFFVLKATCEFSNMLADLVRHNVPDGSVVIADENSAPFLDYATDDIIYYPRMFRQDWVSRHVKDQINPHGPYVLNRLRATTMNELLGGCSDQQLAKLLRQLLRSHIASGRTVALLCATTHVAGWQDQLGPAFKISPVAQDAVGWGVYRVELAAPGTAPSK
jgi:4-amino-4-deoxy-L-arabinose transferase-like glycosyltransferase